MRVTKNEDEAGGDDDDNGQVVWKGLELFIR